MGHNIVVTGIEKSTFHVLAVWGEFGKGLQITPASGSYVVLEAAQVRELIVKLQAEWEITGSQTTLPIKEAKER